MSSDLAISVRNLTKRYQLGRSGRTTSLPRLALGYLRHPLTYRGHRRQRFEALRDVSFDVTRGEVVGIIGRNGAGKSTLLKILSRVTWPDEGAVDLYGRVGSLLEVGTGFHPELTGRENVYLNGAVLGMTRREIDARFDEIVDFSEVSRFLDTPVKRYSSGMRVRLAFSVAAHLDPELLIVDEVLSVGDVNFQQKCVHKMKDIAGEGERTVLFVSHNLSSVEHLCPRSIYLNAGQIMFDGETEEAIRRYLAALGDHAHTLAPGEFDLTARGPAAGSDDLILRKVSLRGRGGALTNTLATGDPLSVTIDVEGLSKHPDAVVVFRVRSQLAQAMFACTTRMKPLVATGERSEREQVLLRIPSVPLAPGDYTVELGVRTWLGNEELDHVREAAEFTVVPTDLYGNGYRLVPRKDGAIVVEWDWELQPVLDDTLAAAGRWSDDRRQA